MNGHHNINTNEATEHLRNILNLGASETKPAPLPNHKMDDTNLNSYRNHNQFQRLDLTGKEETFPIYGVDCSIYSSPLHHNTSCSNILINNIVDYGWEHKFYLGRLVSIHLSGKYLAYASKGLKADSGFVRVIKYNTNYHVRIREFTRSVIDLCFAHSVNRILLGCIDEVGELQIFEIFDDETSLSCKLQVHIVRPDNPPPSIYHRIVWCPFVPDEDIDDSESNSDSVISKMTSLLIATHDGKAEVWDIDVLMKEHGNKNIVSDSVKSGKQLIDQHSQPITSTCFSPDSVAVATASLDGVVKFFQVDFRESEAEPKYLHQWIPHNGKPLSCLYFLDNHKNYGAESQFWKYAVTGADNNQELKVWSCESWGCLQTIRFKCQEEDGKEPCLKAEVDLSANHLVLCDINRKVLYIFKIGNGAMSRAFQYVSVFPLKYAVLSFAISNVLSHAIKSHQSSNDCEEDDEDEDNEDDDHKSDNEYEEKDDGDEDDETLDISDEKYHMELFWITPKAFQSCKITYGPKPSSLLHSEGSTSSSQDSFDIQDSVDLKMENSNLTKSNVMTTGKPSGLSVNSTSLPSPSVTSLTSQRASSFASCAEILLTPNDFSDPPLASLPSNKTNSFKMNEIKETSSDRHDINQDNSIPPESGIRPRRKSSQHSSSSSPSREVAEILLPNQLLDHNNISSKIEQENVLEKENLQGEQQKSTMIIKQQHDYHEADNWPPDSSSEYKRLSRGDGEQSSSMRTNNLSSSIVLPNEESPVLQRLERSIESLSHQINSLADSMVQQNQYLQNEIRALQQQQKFIESQVQNTDALEGVISTKFEHVISENSVSEFAKLEELFNKQENNDNQRFEQHFSSLSQSILNTVNNRLDKMVKQEMKTTILSNVNKYLDNLLAHLQGEILQKLNTTDNALKECVGKHLKSKTFGDTVVQSTVNMMQQSLQIACKDAFQACVVPALDKSCHMLFSQLNEVFSRGVQEYLLQLEQHKQAYITSMESFSNKYHGQIDAIANQADSALKQNAVWQASSNEFSKQHLDGMIAKVRQAIHEEIQKAMKEHTALAIRSNMSTPAPQNEAKCSAQTVLNLAKQGQYNEAFDQALSAVDLKLVLMLCESVPVDHIFGAEKCPLHQNVLLSLIHQISVDIGDKTEVKVRYIEDAIASIDENNLNKSHISIVLGGLQDRVKTFLAENPNHKMNRKLKRISLVIDSFLK